MSGSGLIPIESEPFREVWARMWDRVGPGSVEQQHEVHARELPFQAFARKRLWIRTDRPRERLSAQQRAAIDATLGPDWHPSRGGQALVPMSVLPLQKRYLAIKRRARTLGYRKFLLLKFRRGGFTSLEQAQSYALVAQSSHSSVTTIAHHLDSTQRIFRMVGLFHERDPQAPKALGDSKRELTLANGSSFFVGTAGSSGFARGDTIQRFHGSEASKWFAGRSQRAALFDDLIAGATGAAKYGECVLETTPDGQESFWGLYTEAPRNGWWPIFVRWFDDPTERLAPWEFDAEEVRETITDEEQSLIDRHGLLPDQIAYRRRQKVEWGRLFPQEMPEDDASCFLASGTCYFDVDRLEAIRRELAGVEAVRTHVSGGVETRWEPPEAGIEYRAGVDTSEGLPGCDPNGIGILRLDNGRQVAALHGLFNPRELAGHVARMCTDYNRALVGVERENHGHAVLQKLEDLGYGRPHTSGGPLYAHASSRREAKLGWSTNAETRPVMLQELAEAVETGAMKILDPDLVRECGTFRLQANGRFEADSGAHDDAVMKWAIAWQMRHHRRKRPGILVLEGMP